LINTGNQRPRRPRSHRHAAAHVQLAVVKLKGKRRKKEVDKKAAKNLFLQLDSPAMATRSKRL